MTGPAWDATGGRDAPAGGAVARSALAGDVVVVARALLGCVLVHDGADGRVAVRLTEVEAYGGPDDPGSHARAGRTARTSPMFGPPGHAYVYLSYGIHWCVNVVTGQDGSASAVLLRGGEVVEGAGLARRRRPGARRDADLARGPACLAACLGVDGTAGGADLCGGGPLRLLLPPARHGAGACAGADTVTGVLAGARTGVSGAGGDGVRYPWRLHLAGEPSVSAYRAAVPRRARRGDRAE